ncbi:MAG: hypothetical protein R6V21_00410 [Pelovirga sp.]
MIVISAQGAIIHQHCSIDNDLKCAVNLKSVFVKKTAEGFPLLSDYQALPLIILICVAFASNLPLGYLRESATKYSLRWIIYIHASIPLLVILRQFYGFSWHWIPVTLACAVIGQLIGGWTYRRAQL